MSTRLSWPCAIKNPGIPEVLERVKKSNPDRIIVLPLFPQYASASTGSALQEVMDIVQDLVGYSGNPLHQPVLGPSEVHAGTDRTRQAV